MNITEMRAVVEEVEFALDNTKYTFFVNTDGRGALYLQASYYEPDTVTGAIEQQFTRRWFLSPEMTKSELVQTAFKLVMTSSEHRTREAFKYQGEAVFNPHIDIDALVALSKENRRVYRATKLAGNTKDNS